MTDSTSPQTTDTQTDANANAIVVYLSQHGNTEAAAYLIQKLIDLDVVPLKPVQLYPRDYKNAFEQVRIENELNYLPKVSKLDIDLTGIERIFIGYPNWDDQLPPPVKSWLSQSDLAGKTLIPFTTHASTGAGRSFEQIAELCPDATVLPGLVIEGGATSDNCALALRGRQAARAEKAMIEWLAQVWNT